MSWWNGRNFLVVLVPMVLLVFGCSGVGEEKKMEDSERYIKAPVQDVVDEWMTARNGTIKASGSEAFYYGGEESYPVNPASTDIRYDLPGEHCFLTKDDMESAYASLHVSTAVLDTAEVDSNAKVDKVADFWRSQGWTDIHQGAQGVGEQRIFVVTPLGTTITYAVMTDDGRALINLQMKSLCAKEFGNNSPGYLGDFNERFSMSPSETPSATRSKGE